MLVWVPLRQGLKSKWFIWETIPGSTNRGLGNWDVEAAKKTCRSVTAVATRAYSPWGTLGSHIEHTLRVLPPAGQESWVFILPFPPWGLLLRIRRSYTSPHTSASCGPWADRAQVTRESSQAKRYRFCGWKLAGEHWTSENSRSMVRVQMTATDWSAYRYVNAGVSERNAEGV